MSDPADGASDRPVGDDPLAWETLDRERAFRCEAFEVYTERVRLPDGAQSRFDYVVEPPSAVVLPFTTDGDVVALEEYRHAVGHVALGLPGGSREPEDADLAATAARELREEAGLVAGSLRALAVTEPANGLLASERHYFVATGCTPAADHARDRDESIRLAVLPFEDLLERIRAGSVRDERTVTAALRYHHREDVP